jgi:hypothetical protein
MNGLYPIIRRARRPLIIQDDDAGPPPVPQAPMALVAETGVNYARPVNPKDKHGSFAKGKRRE